MGIVPHRASTAAKRCKEHAAKLVGAGKSASLNQPTPILTSTLKPSGEVIHGSELARKRRLFNGKQLAVSNRRSQSKRLSPLNSSSNSSDTIQNSSDKKDSRLGFAGTRKPEQIIASNDTTSLEDRKRAWKRPITCFQVKNEKHPQKTSHGFSLEDADLEWDTDAPPSSPPHYREYSPGSKPSKVKNRGQTTDKKDSGSRSKPSQSMSGQKRGRNGNAESRFAPRTRKASLPPKKLSKKKKKYRAPEDIRDFIMSESDESEYDSNASYHESGSESSFFSDDSVDDSDLEMEDLDNDLEFNVNFFSSSATQSTAKLSSMQKLSAVETYYHNTLVRLCFTFIAKPPSSAAKRTNEHKNLSEILMAQVILELDEVDVGGDAEAEKKRTELVEEVQDMFLKLDEVVKKDRSATAFSEGFA